MMMNDLTILFAEFADEGGKKTDKKLWHHSIIKGQN